MNYWGIATMQAVSTILILVMGMVNRPVTRTLRGSDKKLSARGVQV